MHLKSKLLSEIPGVIHGFGTLKEPLPQLAFGDAKLPRWHQNHGVCLAQVDSPEQECGDVDALYSFSDSVPVAVVTADCVPILMAHRSGRGIAAIHAGWRGTRTHILKHLWERLASQGAQPQEWIAAIGPSIGPCCYEVSEELALDFSGEFADFGKGVAVPRRRILDLPAINASELRRIGLEVDLIRACTRCSKDPEFHSFRREGKGTRQWSVVMMGVGG